MIAVSTRTPVVVSANNSLRFRMNLQPSFPRRPSNRIPFYKQPGILQEGFSILAQCVESIDKMRGIIRFAEIEMRYSNDQEFGKAIAGFSEHTGVPLKVKRPKGKLSNLLYTHRAVRDILAAVDGMPKEKAEKRLTTLRNKCAQISQTLMVLESTRRPELGATIHTRRFHSNLIIFRKAPRVVIVLAVLDINEDYSAMLPEDRRHLAQVAVSWLSSGIDDPDGP
ncbi:hypothetical protein [Hyphomicrobium zavarzinii]|uniref:hypothetical protein n=1 Tax=Hyphomicrobium zavarzinii TaxID=48292 RepID=UPI00037124BF|nr:hypothetical protein [Hyphomicrobium zavarzinii]